MPGDVCPAFPDDPCEVCLERMVSPHTSMQEGARLLERRTEWLLNYQCLIGRGVAGAFTKS